jgi:hypothetical protein
MKRLALEVVESGPIAVIRKRAVKRLPSSRVMLQLLVSSS